MIKKANKGIKYSKTLKPLQLDKNLN